MTYLLLGAHGMLGGDLREVLRGRDVLAPTRAELDITDADAVRTAASGCLAVINCAAYTRVDDAESDFDQAREINAVGAQSAAKAAAVAGAAFVHVSTDYVFDGNATTPYDEDAALSPVSAYGRSKAEGELLVRAAHPGAYIVRAAWLYGAHGPNFPRAVLARAATTGTVDVVTDQIGQPTWTRDLAVAIMLLLDSAASPGVYHGTNSGSASWYEFARAVFASVGLDPDLVRPTDGSAFRRPAPRPAYSVLGHDRWTREGLTPPRDWRAALAAATEAGVFSR